MNITHHRLRSTLRQRTTITQSSLNHSITGTRRIINADLSQGHTTTSTTASRQIIGRRTTIKRSLTLISNGRSRHTRTHYRTRTSNVSKAKRNLRHIMRNGTTLSLTTKAISMRHSKNLNVLSLRMSRATSSPNAQLNISNTHRLRLTINRRLITSIRTISTLNTLTRSL